MFYVLKITECKRCVGEGLITNYAYGLPSGYLDGEREEIECPACAGRGEVEEKYPLKMALTELGF